MKTIMLIIVMKISLKSEYRIATWVTRNLMKDILKKSLKKSIIAYQTI